MSRVISTLFLALMINTVITGAAFAGFLGFGSDDKGKSGLDFNKGYDINTVATVSGRAASPPREGDRGQLFLEVRSGNGPVEVSLGPGSFWEKKGIPIRPNDEITVKGSKAQGQDGKTYLLTQKLVNKTTGSELELRSEKGDPVWSGRGSAGAGQGRFGGGMFQGGGMMRGGGGMMRH